MTSIAKFILDTISDLQKEVHSTTSLDEGMTSVFYHPFRKTTWFAHLPVKLKSTEDGDDVTYTVNNTFHFLMYSYMRCFFPEIKVKKQFQNTVRICWPHNMGTSPIIEADFKIDDDPFQSFDGVWCDIHNQFYMKPGFREHHNMYIGNEPSFESWKTGLPAYTTNVHQPWFYSMGVAFPLYYTSSQTTITHRYRLRRNVIDLLRMQILRSGKWQELKRVKHEYLERVTPNTRLPTPELWARYSYNTENEIAWLKECGQSSTHTLYIKDVARCDASNGSRYKDVAEVDLHCDTACLAMFWVAENINATQCRNFSNYTTDSSNLYMGWDPIRRTTLRHGNVVHLKSMDSDHFSAAEPRYHFPSPPSEPGYHAFSFAFDSTSTDADVGIVFAGIKSKLSVLIANNNIFLASCHEADHHDELVDVSDPEDDLSERMADDTPGDDDSPRFITRVRLLLMKKITITKIDDKTYSFQL